MLRVIRQRRRHHREDELGSFAMSVGLMVQLDDQRVVELLREPGLVIWRSPLTRHSLSEA